MRMPREIQMWFCFSLRTCALIFGWLSILIGVGLVAIADRIFIRIGVDVKGKFYMEYDTIGFAITNRIMGIALAVTSVLLLIGVYRKIAKLFLPWLAVTAVILSTIFLWVMITVIKLLIHYWEIGIWVLFTCLYNYSLAYYTWLAIYSLHVEIKGNVKPSGPYGSNV